MKKQALKTVLLLLLIVSISCGSTNSKNMKTTDNMKIYFFKCSVSEDLYGASLNKDGAPLPTPGGGKWLPIEILNSSYPETIVGFNEEVAKSEIAKWGCHWFSTKGPEDISWGDEGPPKEIVKQGN